MKPQVASLFSIMTSFDHELKIIEIRLLELERERNSLLERKQTLLVTNAPSQDLPGQEAQPLSTQQKVDLFRSLFRGRENIHAVRWENNQGRNGYALACDNEWEKGLCNKPKVKCGECRNQAFQPLDHEAFHILIKVIFRCREVVWTTFWLC